jgi:hypothetical protein
MEPEVPRVATAVPLSTIAWRRVHILNSSREEGGVRVAKKNLQPKTSLHLWM